MDDRESLQRRQLWSVLGQRLPQSEVVYFTQVVLIYIVIITCIVNLSRGAGDSNLWTCLMSSSLGYLLPNPRISTSRKQEKLSRPQDVESNLSYPSQ